MAQASYVVQSRVNSTLQLAGIIDDYATLDMLLRHNALSEWTMTIDRRSRHLPNLIPVSNPLGMNGNGLIITRDYGAGPKVILSGPITHIDYNKKSQLATLKGYDDKIWLAWRNADTVPASYPYDTEVLVDVPKRHYPLNETSGTTATDSSTSAQNGVYSGTFGFSQGGLIDSPDTSVGFQSANSDEVGVPTVGLAAGNAAWTVMGWGYITAYPPGDAFMWSFGSNVLGQGAGLFITSTGLPSTRVFAGTGSLNGATPVALNQPFMLAMTYNGTSLIGYVNGQPFGSWNPGTINITYGFARIGDFLGVSNFWNGRLARCTFENAALSAGRILAIYQVGRSRLADAASDNRSGVASTVMIAYVNANAGPGTLAKRQVANLTLAADPSVGGQVTGVAREDTLLAFLQNLALQSGDNITFDVQQTLNAGSNTMAFSCAAPADKTSNAIFSDEIGNLADYSYSGDWPTMNVAVVGDGSNTGTARNFLEVSDSASVATYGRVEGFVQGAASTDYQTMLNAGSAALLQTKAATNLSILPVDTAGLQYQRDYNLGDKVTVYIEGQTIQDKLREVHIALTKGSGANAPDELVTPAIGQPSVAQAVTNMLSWLSNSVTKRLQANANRVGQLERNR